MTRVATTEDTILNQLQHYIFNGRLLPKQQHPKQVQHLTRTTVRCLQLKMSWFSKFSTYWFHSNIAKKTMFERSPHRSLGRGKDLTKGTRDGVLTMNLRWYKKCNTGVWHLPENKLAQERTPSIAANVPNMPWVKLGLGMFEHCSHH